MNISIKKTSGSFSKENSIIIADKKTEFKSFNLSEKEIQYAQDQIKAGVELITINQYSRLVYLVIIHNQADKNKSLEKYRVVGNNVLKLVNAAKIESITLVDAENQAEETLAFAEGMALGNYQFLKYFSDAKKKKNSLKSINVFGKKISEQAIEELEIIVRATLLTRQLVDEPVGYLDASQLAKEFQSMGKEAGFKVEVFNKTKIKALKMGGLLGVNKGSIDEPTFSIMEWKPKNAKNTKPYVFVGKGVVFDTGGINIKTSGMGTMKCDMGGAAAVGGAIYAIAKAKLPYHVIGLVPATDNRVNGNSLVPGDVITIFDGTTVEVLNTDAEGRLILADALSYAKQYKPELVIDLATLTGAAVRAIGNYGIVGMGNADEKTKNSLIASGFSVHERVVDFPFWDEYAKELKSDVADLKNQGSPLAGAITAGKFLEHFTDYSWYHLDIAGPSFNEKTDSYRGKGGTGTGVRLLFDFIKKQ